MSGRGRNGSAFAGIERRRGGCALSGLKSLAWTMEKAGSDGK
jgi:hypothetical protein